MTAINLNRPFLFMQECLSFFVFVCLFLITLLPNRLLANDNAFQLTEITQLNYQEVLAKNWQQLIANPANLQQYFILNEAGGVYLVDGNTITPQPLLDLSNTANTQGVPIKLTAMTLHPSFSLRNQVGYGTFYTAHIESIDHNSKTKRLQERSADIELAFDAVVTEWQFNTLNYQTVDLSTKREILRIGVLDNQMVIKQLAFNPFIKSWNDDFALLYVALTGQKKWQKPLYSGAILRINPAKFGLRSFTIPISNPFLKDSKVHDAIYLFGGQNIQQFIWPNKTSEQLLLLHHYEQKQQLSYSNGGENWQKNPPKNVVHQTPSNSLIHHAFTYQGKKSPHLRRKLLLLHHQNDSWLISALPLKTSVNQKMSDKEPREIWQLPTKQLLASDQLDVIHDRLGEITFFNKTTGMLYQLSQDKGDFLGSDIGEISEQRSASGGLFILLLALIAAIAYYLINRNKFSAKNIVKQQFSHLEISESQQQIGLYRRHKSNAEIVVDVIDIVSSEIQLNEHSINVINTMTGHGFSNEKEQDLCETFAKEHIDKMVDGKVRMINLLLIDKQNKHHVICLYMRKGSNRMTKKGYFNVIDELVDWCWLVAKAINPEQTGVRAAKPAKKVPDKTEASRIVHNETPLHNQAAAIRPATHKEVELAEQPETANIKVPMAKASNAGEQVAAQKNSIIGTELVNALEKLVNLKQQGYLTTEEFAKAKEKLLQSLFEE